MASETKALTGVSVLNDLKRHDPFGLPMSEKEHPRECGMECGICMGRCYENSHLFENGEDKPCRCGSHKDTLDAKDKWNKK